MTATVAPISSAGLPLSAAVDLLRLSARVTPVIRTSAMNTQSADAILAAARAAGFAAAMDEEGYVAIGRDDKVVARVLEIDASPRPHERHLGALFGYPACCVARVVHVGESGIDELADEAARWAYRGAFWAIDPTGYRKGQALISHIPCCASCVGSLRDASRALDHLGTSPRVPPWEPIRQWAKLRARL